MLDIVVMMMEEFVMELCDGLSEDRVVDILRLTCWRCRSVAAR